MAKSKKTKKASLHNIAQAEELERRMSNYRRAASAFERETLRRLLRTLGVPGLGAECGRPLTTAGVNEQPDMWNHYPLKLEVRFTGDSNPPPMPWSKPSPEVGQMIYEFSGTEFNKNCVCAKAYVHRDDRPGNAVIFAYRGESLILHDRPGLTEGPPLFSRRLHNGCVVQIHWFEPFIDDANDSCRHLFAEDGSKLMHRIESDYPFRDASWAEWEDRELPRDS